MTILLDGASRVCVTTNHARIAFLISLIIPRSEKSSKSPHSSEIRVVWLVSNDVARVVTGVSCYKRGPWGVPRGRSNWSLPRARLLGIRRVRVVQEKVEC